MIGTFEGEKRKIIVTQWSIGFESCGISDRSVDSDFCGAVWADMASKRRVGRHRGGSHHRCEDELMTERSTKMRASENGSGHTSGNRKMTKQKAHTPQWHHEFNTLRNPRDPTDSAADVAMIESGRMASIKTQGSAIVGHGVSHRALILHCEWRAAPLRTFFAAGSALCNSQLVSVVASGAPSRSLPPGSWWTREPTAASVHLGALRSKR
ncbi:hypothetical protein R1flu_012040 [Riccia fluitans]|uniref:Uncharacterized protein n=1 Tax=Riccia fluitans TaxID=41844 RepID=A0ABD1Z9R0_9MARC